MEKVLVSEVLYSKGHIKLNEKYVKCIADNFDVRLIDDGHYFSSLNSTKYNKIIIPCHMVNRVEKLKSRLYARYLKRIAQTAKQLGIRNVVLLSFHTEAFGLVYHCFEGINVCVVHHYEIDRMTKRPQEIKAFNKYKNQITHCVLEEFIADGLIRDFNVTKDQVYVVNTPVDMLPKIEADSTYNIFIGIGQSTDQNFIDELVNLDKSGYLSEDVKGKIILRSKTTKYKGSHVEVFTGFLERDAYDRLYNSASACIVRYESTYKLRSSGSIDDAFRNHKKVVVMGFPAGYSYAQMFPENCICVEKSEEILDLLKSPPQGFDENDEEKFKNDHSIANVAEQWKKAILHEKLG